MDENPNPGISYYRLKQTDFDGSFTYSNVAAVEVTTSNSFATAFYNNNEEMIEITFSGNENSVATIYLINLAGKILKQEEFFTLKKQMNIKDLPAGIYFCRLEINGTEINKKIIVAR